MRCGESWVVEGVERSSRNSNLAPSRNFSGNSLKSDIEITLVPGARAVPMVLGALPIVYFSGTPATVESAKYWSMVQLSARVSGPVRFGRWPP